MALGSWACAELLGADFSAWIHKPLPSIQQCLRAMKGTESPQMNPAPPCPPTYYCLLAPVLHSQPLLYFIGKLITFPAAEALMPEAKGYSTRPGKKLVNRKYIEVEVGK